MMANVKGVGNELRVGAVTIANIQFTASGISISFTSLGGTTVTTALVNEILQAITYVTTSDAPPSGITLDYTFNDGDLTTPLSALASITVNVNAVNDAPSGTDGTITAAEDQPYTFGVSDFGFSDLDGHLLTAVKISSLPTIGTLKLGSTAVAADEIISLNDLTNGGLTYTPAANASGTNHASFTFQVQDNGGISSSG